MIDTLNTYQIADRLFRDENAGFSYNGAKALAEYLDTEENAMAEFDPVAIRCDWSEYPNAQEAAQDYDWEPAEHIADDGQECDADAVAWLNERTTVIEFEGGVIVHIF